MNKCCKHRVRTNVLSSRTHIFLACSLFAGMLYFGSEHSSAQEQTITLDGTVRTQVVEAAAQALEDRYIFPDLGMAMANKIRQQNAAHAYDSLTTGTDLSRQLTADLFAVGHDKHVHVDSEDGRRQVRTGPGPDGLGPGGPGPQMRVIEGPPPAAAVTEFKRLPGNIGYIRVDRMLPAQGDGDSIDTAMSVLADSNALIIDLRHNGGGDPMMVAYLCTYLFPAGAHIHLNDFVSREDPAPHASYTLPSVPGKTFARDVYLLTSHFTFSGGEEMAYDLQALKRATLVGETTGGGANPGAPVPLPDNFSIFIPTGRSINPLTKTNWEGVGVKPDVSVPADQALEKAELLVRNHSAN